MVIIHAKIDVFNYWLQEVKGYYFWNGLRQNGAKLSKEEAVELIKTINSPWRLSIENV